MPVTKILATDINTTAARGVGQNSDIPIVGGTPALVVLGPNQSAGNPANTAEGRQWYDTTGKSVKQSTAVGIAQLSGVVWSLATDSNTITNTTSLVDFNQSFTFPANSLTAGKVINFYFGGDYAVTGTPTIRLVVLLGAVLYDFGLQAISVGVPHWLLIGQIIVGSAGVSGAARGYCSEQMGAQSAVPGLGSNTIDTTIANVMKVQATFSAAALANQITMRSGTIAVA